MGVIKDTKRFVKRKVDSLIDKAENGISDAARLSTNQIANVAERRDEYLCQFDAKDANSSEALSREIEKNIGVTSIEVYQAYLEQIKKAYCPKYLLQDSFNVNNRIKVMNITRWVFDTDEANLDKLVNVYAVLCREICNIALIYKRTMAGTVVSIGVVNTSEDESDPTIIDSYYKRIVNALQGNFPGIGIELGDISNDFSFDDDQMIVPSVALVSNLTSEKSEGFVSQSIEKVLDGNVPNCEKDEYTIVLLASPVTDQLDRMNGLYKMYSDLAPYAEWQISYGVSEDNTEGSSVNLGMNVGIGVQTSFGISEGVSVPTPGGILSAGSSQSTTISGNFGVDFSRASNVSVSIGRNQSLTQSYTNFGVKHTLEVLEREIKRYEEASALGMWEFAAYVFSENPVIANNVAHMYQALTNGDDSYISSGIVELWDGEREKEEAKIIYEYVKRLHHPVFCLSETVEDIWLQYPLMITPATVLTGKELAKALNIPKHSISGVPVLESVSFGREAHSLAANTLDFDIGNAYHMYTENKNQRICLSKDELTKHTFITGSTGSGKSNTVYRMLAGLEKDVNFLVIEPAKGEYKSIIGRRPGVKTYGTNPCDSRYEVLRINPFRFPLHTHILEHLDRLVEIFNVCWPMYAAMPAVLKSAIERSYIKCGWDLQNSCNEYDNRIFPTFFDVASEVHEVINESEYSADNKGDYIGSLVTRLSSLTNGINGIVFSSCDVPDELLFDRNVIVDLSRVGSTETKSLIMGLLVLRLQEYRMEKRNISGSNNEQLNHVTVLEEAHNLLKRTSTEQTLEGSNLVGKSVEMLANSIAEMRTYGEGFIIADQSPGLLDMSVIRNTNTKIILRLPDYSDRELVGRAAGLNDNQIVELSRLEKGVAAISQSDWLEPVLCKIDKYVPSGELVIGEDYNNVSNCKDVVESLLDCIMSKELYRKGDRLDIMNLKETIINSDISSSVKCDLIRYLNASGPKAELQELGNMLCDWFGDKPFEFSDKEYQGVREWTHRAVSKMQPDVRDYTNNQIDMLLALILRELARRKPTFNRVFSDFTEAFDSNGGVY